MAEIMSYGEQYDIPVKSCLFILFPFGQENLSFIQSLPPSIQSICVQIVENNQSN